MEGWSRSREIARGSGFRVGEFRCGPGDVRWRTENWIGTAPHVVFPGPAVGIHQAGRDPLVATPNEVVLYNGDACYRRHLVSDAGDHSVFVELESALSDEVGTFTRASVPVTGAVYVLHRLLARLDNADPLLVDECVITALAQVRATGGPPAGARVGPGGREAVEAVKATVATRLRQRLTLADLAAGVNYSPFHLARLFRAHTGRSVCAYRAELRVRYAVERILDHRDSLATIASDLGFASHSHLTTAVRRSVGVRPIELRRGGRARLSRLVALADEEYQAATR